MTTFALLYVSYFLYGPTSYLLSKMGSLHTAGHSQWEPFLCIILLKYEDYFVQHKQTESHFLWQRKGRPSLPSSDRFAKNKYEDD